MCTRRRLSASPTIKSDLVEDTKADATKADAAASLTSLLEMSGGGPKKNAGGAPFKLAAAPLMNVLN